MTSNAALVVLAVGAHPDDLESTCGGTLAALAERGVPVHLAVTTAGECGAYELDAEATRARRLDEARRAAAVLGAASFHHLGMRDQGSERTIERRRELTDHVRRLRATLLLTHGPGDYHVDHRRTHELVTDTRMAAAVPNFGDEPPLAETPDLVYFDSAAGLVFEPHLWLDISDTMDVRRRALEAHESQFELMRRMYGEDLGDSSETLAKHRGRQRGCRYAEAFQGCGTFPSPDGGLRRLVLALEGA